jgi:LPS sulfotransferase NodH
MGDALRLVTVPAGALIQQLLGPIDRHRPWRVLDRPVFVIAAPRSGSTALFDLLAAHPGFVSWPFEAHEAFERAKPASHPVEMGRRWPPSYADERMRRVLSRELYLGRLAARRRANLPVGRLERLALRRIRLLEKTPANVLRVEVLAQVFPDASFVFLHRDATSNIASLIEAWETPSAAHATVMVEGRPVRWMMLAPEGWPDYADADVPTRAAFQWRSANETALTALQALPRERWTSLSYESFVADPVATATRVLDWLGVGAHPDVLAAADRLAAPGRTSFSPPRPDKWLDRAHLIEPLLPDLADLRTRLGYTG